MPNTSSCKSHPAAEVLLLQLFEKLMVTLLRAFEVNRVGGLSSSFYETAPKYFQTF